MTDIDFDELDRAVSSLMDKHGRSPENTSSQPSSQPPVDNTPQVSEGVVQPDTASISAAETAPQPSALSAANAPAPSIAAAPIVQRRGRFMDVVTSSGTRTSATERPDLSARPSREAAPLQPSSQAFQQVAGEPVTQDTSNATTSDMQSNQEFEPRDLDALEPLEFAPLESPFIEGIAVDKRPLGSVSHASPEPLDATPSDASEVVMPDPMTFGVGQDADVNLGEPASDTSHPELESTDPWASETQRDSPAHEEPLRPELSPEVLAVESSEIIVEPQPVVAEQPHSSARAESTDQSGLPGNITPQYNAVAADTPQPGGIFEAAAETPQPLAHPEKKKSGWMVMVWILLLVVIGAAGGVAAWYFLLR